MEESQGLEHLGPHIGARWKALDPRITPGWTDLRISGPDQRGRRQQVLGGPEPGHPQGLIFWESCNNRGC